MRDILRLIQRDLHRATSSVLASIVIFGLIVIPALFTWFNVSASWDPFSNTKNLKVAVASSDAGYESDLIPVRINIGDQALSALRANDDFDWVITSEEEAIDGTESGAYYAAIVLPESFSADMVTFFAEGHDSDPIAYYTNEKKNALAPTLTEQGAEGVSARITEVFTETLSDLALGLISSLSDFLTDDETRVTLAKLELRVSKIGSDLRGAAQTAEAFGSVIESSMTVVGGANDLVSGSSMAIEGVSTAVSNGSAAIEGLRSNVQTANQGLANALASTSDAYDDVSASVDNLFAELDSGSVSQADAIDTLAQEVQLQIDSYTRARDALRDEIAPMLPDSALDGINSVIVKVETAISRQQDVYDRLVSAAQAVRDNNSEAQASRQEVQETVAQAKQAIDDAENAYISNLKPQLDELSSTLDIIKVDIEAIGTDLASASSNLSAQSGSVLASLLRAFQTTGEISDSLKETADEFDELAASLARAADTGELDEISAIIGTDPSVLARSLAQPVGIERIAVFPVASFGAGMAPLYMVLALWVGALLMTVAIRVDVKADVLPIRPDLTPAQQYLGRYGIFALVGLAQASLVTTGLILFVQIEARHPVFLILTGWIISIVFTLLVYTAVAAFGNAGKALAVLLLVVQISGSGGAYPLAVLPEWFRQISPFLPATHAIDAVRSAIAGVYGGDLWASLGLLCLFAFPALLIGLVLRRPLIQFNRGLTEALESTKLM